MGKRERYRGWQLGGTHIIQHFNKKDPLFAPFKAESLGQERNLFPLSPAPAAPTEPLSPSTRLCENTQLQEGDCSASFS